MKSWLDDELAACRFADKRLAKRFKNLAEQLSEGIGESIPMACEDWSATKAAYRFLSNERVSEQEIRSGHFQATQERVRASAGTVLVLHDTTEFTFKRDDPDLIGNTVVVPGRKHINGKPERRAVCGILMHSSLVVTLEGLPLGIARDKVLEQKRVQGNQRFKENNQPDSRSY